MMFVVRLRMSPPAAVLGRYPKQGTSSVGLRVAWLRVWPWLCRNRKPMRIAWTSYFVRICDCVRSHGSRRY